MKKPLVIFLHLGYWLIYFLLLSVIFSIISLQIKKINALQITTLPLFLLSFIPNLFSFYFAYFLLFTKFLSQKKFILLAVSGIFLCFISTISALFIAIFFFGINQPVLSNLKEFIPLIFSFFFIAAIHAAIALVIRGFVAWFEDIKLKDELRQRTHETEIALIKSQINPHFLFNTINNIDVLITKDSTKASQYLNRLSDILRYMVYDTKSERIDLQKELGYIEKYLELQKIRTTNPNYVNLKIVGEPQNLQIAPMLFFPFIENAFKHTENDKKLNSISINFSIKGSSINFECKNTYQKISLQKQDYGGLGNELIQKRLNLLYPGKHDLEINEIKGIYTVKLTIDIDK
ncbi:MAG: histidine kinase [Pyrinomonadaceae bacterium]|nr:histidine kinase [Pyrinomonadaceae bacterium]